MATLHPSSPFPGKVSRPESGHSFRLPVCCLTEIDGRPRTRGCEQPDISEPDTEWFCCIGTVLGRQKAEKFELMSDFKGRRFQCRILLDRRAADRQT